MSAGFLNPFLSPQEHLHDTGWYWVLLSSWRGERLGSTAWCWARSPAPWVCVKLWPCWKPPSPERRDAGAPWRSGSLERRWGSSSPAPDWNTHTRAKCMLYQYTEPTVLHNFSMNAVNTFFYYFVATWVIRAKTHYYCWITNTGCRVQNTGQFIRLNQQCVNLFGLEGKKMFKFKKMPWFGLKNNEAPVEFK